MNSGLPTDSVPASGKLVLFPGTRTQTSTKNHTHPPPRHLFYLGADRHTDPGPALGKASTTALITPSGTGHCRLLTHRTKFKTLGLPRSRRPQPLICPAQPPGREGHSLAYPLPSAWKPLLLPPPPALQLKGQPRLPSSAPEGLLWAVIFLRV